MSESIENPAHATWRQLLRQSPFFVDTPDYVIDETLPRLEEVRLSAGEVLVREGELGESMFMVADGRLDVRTAQDPELVIKVLEKGAIIGEVGLLIGGKRAATVTALEDSSLIKFRRDPALELVDKFPVEMTAILAKINQTVRQRMRTLRLLELLKKQLFSSVDADTLAKIQQRMTWTLLKRGELLCRQGDKADNAYILVYGSMVASVTNRWGVETPVGTVSPGEWVGDMALISEQARTATLQATRDCQLACMSKEVFRELMTTYPDVLLSVSRLMVERLLRQQLPGMRQTQPALSITLLPASPGVDIMPFANALSEALARHGSTMLVTAKLINAEFSDYNISQVPHDHPGALRLEPWLTKVEEEHDYVIYHAGSEWSGWTERAMRMADRVLIVADGRSAPGLQVNEQKLMQQREQISGLGKIKLVLLHDGDAVAHPGTRSWLAVRPSVDCYHVRRRHTSDVERVARLITGRAVSLVIGGGGSRSCSSLGILRAMHELGIPVDAIGGTSMGGVIAAGYGAGFSIHEMMQKYRRYNLAPLDATFPILSLSNGYQLKKLHTEMLGRYDLEDLALPVFCVASNITKGDVDALSRGPAVTAVRATMAVPGVLPPVVVDGDMLVDGGLFNNVPVDIMAKSVGGTIIAIDAMPKMGSVPQEVSLPPVVSGWKVLGEYITRPLRKKSSRLPPNIVEILMRCMTTGSVSLKLADSVTQVASLYLHPEVNWWNLFDYSCLPEIAEQGYRSTYQQLADWWQSRCP